MRRLDAIIEKTKWFDSILTFGLKKVFFCSIGMFEKVLYVS